MIYDIAFDLYRAIVTDNRAELLDATIRYEQWILTNLSDMGYRFFQDWYDENVLKAT